MAPRTNSRRLSLDFIRRPQPSNDHHSSSSGALISRYMDLRLTSHINQEVVSTKCECCGLSEDCTRAFERQVRDQFCSRWLCGLCSEAVKSELDRLGLQPHIVSEAAVKAHMEVCRNFNKNVRLNPAMSLASAMAKILKKGSSGDGGGGGCRVLRSFSAIPSLGD